VCSAGSMLPAAMLSAMCGAGCNVCLLRCCLRCAVRAVMLPAAMGDDEHCGCSEGGARLVAYDDV
jgi:hypothetical protein